MSALNNNDGAVANAVENRAPVGVAVPPVANAGENGAPVGVAVPPVANAGENGAPVGVAVPPVGNAGDNAAAVGADRIRSSLPRNPRDLVFKNTRYRLPNSIQYVSLEELESHEEVNTSCKCFIGIVVRYKRAKSSKEGRTLFSRVSQTAKPDQNFDRTMIIMCLNSQRGRNTALVTMNSSKADKMFRPHLGSRDGPDGYGPFAVVAIPRPDNVTNLFGDKAGIPLLTFSSGMRIVDVAASSFTLLESGVDSNVERLQAFYYPRVSLELMNCNLDHTPCCGFLCDSVGMKTHDGNWRSGCPCYTATKTLGYGILDLSLRISVQSTGELIKSLHFTSRTFTNLLTTSGFPLSINAAMLEQTGADDTIIAGIADLLSDINTNHGGFRVLGWVRLGRITDQASKDSAERETVASSEMNHHITKVLPNCERSAYSGGLVNVEEIYNRSLDDQHGC